MNERVASGESVRSVARSLDVSHSQVATQLLVGAHSKTERTPSMIQKCVMTRTTRSRLHRSCRQGLDAKKNKTSLLRVKLFLLDILFYRTRLLDLGITAMMVRLLGWHWEFLPSFFAKLIPSVDLVPFWTIAVASVWRKAKREAAVEMPTTDKQKSLAQR